MHHTDPVDRAYAILGLRPGSSSSEIRRRYKHLVKTWHPDRWAGDPTSQAEAAQRMREINLAWQVLTESARAMAAPPSAQMPPLPRRDSQPPPLGRRLTEAEVDAIVHAMADDSPISIVGEFLLWAVPLAVAFIITSGHGRYLSDYWVSPTNGQKAVAAGLVLFSLGVLVRRAWLRRH